MALSILSDRSEIADARRARRAALPLDALLVGACLALMAADLVAELARTIWRLQDYGYSPLIFVMGIAMAIMVAQRGGPDVAEHPRPVAWAPLMLALVVFVAARTIGNPFIAYCAMLLAAASSIVLLAGPAMLRLFALPLVALAFAVPLPGAIVTDITFPLKLWISRGAVALLGIADLPVARDGVMIEIGNYQLLVAEACSGLQSMFSLIAVAVVYSFITAPAALGRAALFIAAALPIVVLVNIARVVALALITFWFGDAAGEGFLHSVAGVAMFAAALVMMAGLDRLLPTRLSPMRWAPVP